MQRAEERTIVRYRPRKESARKAPSKGSKEAVPDQALTFLAAVAVDCWSWSVKKVIKLEETPQQANLSATSTPDHDGENTKIGQGNRRKRRG